MPINRFIITFFANKTNADEFRQTRLCVLFSINRGCVFSVDGEFILDKDYFDELHIYFCDEDYEPYIKHIALYLQTIGAIKYVGYYEHVFNDFFAEHPFKKRNDYIANTPSHKFILLCDSIYALSVVFSKKRDLHFEHDNGIDFYEANYYQFIHNPEVAHIYLCALPEYVIFCKENETRKSGMALIYDELQSGTERHLLADEYIVANIIKFL